MRKRYSRSYTVLSFLTMFSYRELPFRKCFFLAEDEGFEPPQTESESGVLPLHKSPNWPLAEAHDYYNDFSQKVKTNFFFFAEIKTGRYGPLMVKE